MSCTVYGPLGKQSFTVSFAQDENEKLNCQVNIEGYLCFIYWNRRRSFPRKNSCSLFWRTWEADLNTRPRQGIITGPSGKGIDEWQTMAEKKSSGRRKDRVSKEWKWLWYKLNERMSVCCFTKDHVIIIIIISSPSLPQQVWVLIKSRIHHQHPSTASS